MLIRPGALDVIVIDSVAAETASPKSKAKWRQPCWFAARLMSQALRKMTGALAQAGTTAIFINQLREKIGVFFGTLKPPPVVKPEALRLRASRHSSYSNPEEWRRSGGQPHARHASR